MHEELNHLVSTFAGLSIDFLELISIGIILYTTFLAFFKLLKHDPNARVYLLHGQSIGLTFKLGSEILRTVTARNMDELLQIGMIIVIKAAMTWLIHWELKGIEHEQSAMSASKKTLGEVIHSKMKEHDEAPKQ
ncbi:DUF1622 domain-containing protein [Dubosiella newyorkensis]|uniref:DUF1622 domain-containing protein n=2 Tax=Dubosiella newyorkensis TaxID=1862672 RepID=A0A1U7NLI7_9FIRM|nr:DUF1622 domain-containing protein [Dubosiella newyorkensis]OLU45593.1 hypothetical protein BO225_08075 [Dubosiella newyorkensis]